MMTRDRLTSSSVLLASGGGRGITAECVVALAKRYKCRFILLGRSASVNEPHWAASAEDERALQHRAMQVLRDEGQKPIPAVVTRMVNAVLRGRQVQATLAAVAKAGGEARYISVDITDSDALRSALEPVSDQVTGILHGAGALADRLIESKTNDDFERVVATKVDGLANLLTCVPVGQLRHLVLFSSVAALYGNPGQADYAIANEALDKAAHRIGRENAACRVLAVNWGPWDGGMVSPALKRVLASRGIEVIPVPVGTSILADELSTEGATQIAVGSPMMRPAGEPDSELRSYQIRRRLTLEANPFLRDHVIGGCAVLPTVCAVGWIVNACEGLYPGYTFFRLEDYQVLKGIVFDGTQADEYTLELKEVSKNREELVFEGMVRSATVAEKPRFHYSARVTLVRDVPEAPSLDAFDCSERQPRDGATLYADSTLFHGPSFRGVDRVLNLDASSATLRCVMPEITVEGQGQFPVQTFNSYLADAQLQGMLIWAKKHYGCGGLPLQIRRGEQYRQTSFGDVTYATLRVLSNTDSSLVADVTVHDEQGRVYSRVSGAEITLSDRLNKLFELNTLLASAEE
jgi:NAD(P)-dependent dehydrogenase (short-subunit alcohol dehydrogenase family)